MEYKESIIEKYLKKSRYLMDIQELFYTHDMLNWVKANRKLMNAGAMKENRVAMFKVLLELCEQNKRVNQWK